jgi:hypothetical protein
MVVYFKVPLCQYLPAYVQKTRETLTWIPDGLRLEPVSLEKSRVLSLLTMLLNTN